MFPHAPGSAHRTQTLENQIAPEEPDVFFTYTGMLAAIGEHEWVAALTRPRLRAGERSPRAWLNYARALHALGLREEAVQTLSQPLAELPSERSEVRRQFQEYVARWSGCVAEVGTEVETHPGTDVLRRTVLFLEDGKRKGRCFEAGSDTPFKRVINVRLDRPRHEFDILLEQQNSEEPFEPHNLGAFTVSGYDTSRLREEPLKVLFLYLAGGKIECAPWQGKRRVKVSWNLVPPPRHESAEA